MGTICILLGLIILVAFTGGGFLISNALLGNQLYATLLGLAEVASNPTMLYVVVVGACAFIGLLICLGLVMSGLTYNRVCKNAAAIRKLTRG